MWRGVACLTIVVYHTALVMVRHEQRSGQSGRIIGLLVELLGVLWIAVPWFFVISGYCITATVDSSRRRPRAPLDYFKRRVRRIFPPYWTILVLTLLVAWAASRGGWARLLADQDDVYSNPMASVPAQLVGNLTLTETWRHHIVGRREPMFVGQAWSLCYEEQFYLVSGLILLLMPRRYFTGIVLVTLLACGLAVLRALRILPSVEGFFFDGNWLMFASGVLLYYAINYSSRYQRIAIALLFAGVAASTTLPAARAVMKALAPSLLASSVFALMLLILHPFDDRLARARALRFLFFCGRMCYSMYLVHILVAFPLSHGFFEAGLGAFWPTILVTVPLATALSVGFAYVFFVRVESRYLNSRSRPATSLEERSVSSTAMEPVPVS
jgi:peptidoglycan/LPS O-acetylase OafA/YrhL